MEDFTVLYFSMSHLQQIVLLVFSVSLYLPTCKVHTTQTQLIL